MSNNIIQLLPDSVANQIAAGEVVQRPASVVKELLENAVDAGAKTIKLTVKDAGRTLIQVTDDGCGMTEADARMCFERHATSKIKKAADIFNILTMGFRGEAMASIAAVAHVELKTKDSESDVGTRLKISGSDVEVQEPVSWNTGTNIAVKNLFFNTPARRQFLKSEQVEYKHIIDEFFRVALARNDIEFTLENNKRIIYSCLKGNLKQRIIQLMGKKYEERLVPVEEETPLFTLKGFVVKPEHARKTRGEQFLFVNKRFIKSRYIHHAIFTAYKELIEASEHPSYFLFFTLPPESIDVNIHPTKTEIKFRDERPIYKLTESTVKKALGMHNITPSLDFDSLTSLEITPKKMGEEVVVPGIHVNPDFNPFKENVSRSNTAQIPHARTSAKENQAWNDLLKIQSELQIDVGNEVQQEKIAEHEIATQEFIQIAGRFILTRIKSGLVLIDQKRAHERILYEAYLNQIESKTPATQTNLFAEQVELTSGDYALMEMHLEMLNQIGFKIEPFGGKSLVYQGIPSGIYIGSAQEFTEKLLDDIKHFGTTKEKSVHEKLAAGVAKRSAIPYGRKLTKPEMQHLSDQLFACEIPGHSPSGKTTIVTFTANDLTQFFE